MTTIRAPKHLDANGITRCWEHDDSEELTIDLTNCEFISPPGLVFIATMMNDAATRNAHVTMKLGKPRDVLKYCDRMGLADRAFGAAGDEFPVVDRHETADRFVPLSDFDAAGHVDGAVDDVCRALRRQAEGWSINIQALNNTIFEIGQNVEQHAGSTGLVALQHFPNASKVEFAIGDHGVGIRGSLEAAGIEHDSESDAVRDAVENHISSIQDEEPWRGAGLPGLMRILCGVEVRGQLVVQTGHTRVTYRHEAGKEFAVRSDPMTYCWPGTLVLGKLTTGRS